MRAEAGKDSSGIFRVFLLDEEDNVVPHIFLDEDENEVGREEGLTLENLLKAVKDSETIGDMPVDGGGFGAWRPAQRLAERINQEILEANREAQRQDARGGDKSKSTPATGTGRAKITA